MTELETLIPNDATYASARQLRDSLQKSIAAERGALDRVGKMRLRECDSAEDPAAKGLCLRLNDLAQLHNAGLPIGWSPPAWPDLAGRDTSERCQGNGASAVYPKDCTNRWHPLNILAAVAGWLLTGIATTLGAPFWFDTLSRLVKLRGSGARINGDGSGAAAPEKSSTMSTSTSAPSVTPTVAGSQPMSDALNTAEAALAVSDVERIQRGLGLTGTQITGFFDANTRAAIKQRQSNQGVESTGELTQTQVQQLLGLSQGASDEYAG